MKRYSLLLAATMLVGAAGPTFAGDDRVAGAVIGGVAGGVVGSQIGGHTGAAIGALFGAVVGAEVADNHNDRRYRTTSHGYGYAPPPRVVRYYEPRPHVVYRERYVREPVRYYRVSGNHDRYDRHGHRHDRRDRHDDRHDRYCRH